MQDPFVAVAEKSAECLSNLKIYFVVLRSFDGETNVFGDIVRLSLKFKQIGINTSWFSSTQPQTDWTSDHGKVDPVLGDEVAFEHLVQEGHREISNSSPNYFVIMTNIQSIYNRHGELDSKIECSSSTTEILQYCEELSHEGTFQCTKQFLRSIWPISSKYIPLIFCRGPFSSFNDRRLRLRFTSL